LKTPEPLKEEAAPEVALYRANLEKRKKKKNPVANGGGRPSRGRKPVERKRETQVREGGLDKDLRWHFGRGEIELPKIGKKRRWKKNREENQRSEAQVKNTLFQENKDWSEAELNWAGEDYQG